MLRIHMRQNIIFFNKKRESIGLRHFYDSKAFIKYSNDMDDIHKSIEYCNPKKAPAKY